MTTPIGEFSQDDLDAIRSSMKAAKHNLAAIDKLSLINFPADEIARMRAEAQKILDDGQRILDVYANGK